MKSLIVVLISSVTVWSFASGPQVLGATKTITEATMRLPLNEFEITRVAQIVREMIGQGIFSAERKAPTFPEAAAIARKLEPNLAREMIQLPSGGRGNYLSTPADWTIVIVNTNPHLKVDEIMTQVTRLFSPSRIDETSHIGSISSEITIHGRPDDILNTLRHLNGEVQGSTVSTRTLKDIQIAGVKRKGVTSKFVFRGSEFVLSYEQAVRIVPAQNPSTSVIAAQVAR